MLRKLSRRLTYANVMSTIAVFVAVGTGGAYAANTVFSSDIADNEVYPADVRDDNLSGGGLTASDLANGSITTGEVRDDTQFPYGLYSQDLAEGSVGSSEVKNNSVTGEDIKDEFLNGLDISNGSLNDEDVGQATFVHFAANIGTVAAEGCAYLLITGINATGDHLLLTPDADDSTGGFIYSVQYRQAQESAYLVACNNNNVILDDGTTHFNLLVFDAQ